MGAELKKQILDLRKKQVIIELKQEDPKWGKQLRGVLDYLTAAGEIAWVIIDMGDVALIDAEKVEFIKPAEPKIK